MVTAGHLATCPRMLKAADALAMAGYRVRVVSTRHIAWATAVDDVVRAPRRASWQWTVVDYSRGGSPATYAWSGARRRLARSVAGAIGVSRCPVAIAARAYGRVHSELVRRAIAEPSDLYYGGTTGALAATAEAARRTGVPYALDLEDFHSGEHDEARSRFTHSLARRIEGSILPGAAVLTASSSAISAAYNDTYGVSPVTVRNTFPLPARAPDVHRRDPERLKLYWFSQTIGPGRGLEDAVRAIGLAGVASELHLRGRLVPAYGTVLVRLAAQVAPRLTIVVHEPASPDAMVELCREYDVGLALEQNHVVNRALCLTNKAFTYVLAGLAVAMTDTPGQRPLGLDLGDGAVLYSPGDVSGLGERLKRWATDDEALIRAKKAAWQAARTRWHWEHAEERGALVAAIARAVR